MTITDALIANKLANGTQITLEYTENGSGDTIKVTYNLDNSYFGASSTLYTHNNTDYVKKAGDGMTGVLTNTTAFDGGFKIEERDDINNATP